MLQKNIPLEENETHCVNDCVEELKMFKITKSSCEGESRSLVYKILRTNPQTSTEKPSPSISDDSRSEFEYILPSPFSLSPSGFPPEDSKLVSFDTGDSSEGVTPENYSNVVEIPCSSLVEQEPYTTTVKSTESQKLRRSSRLQALRTKSVTTPGNSKQEGNLIDNSECKGLNRKRRRTVSKKRPSKSASGTEKTKNIRSRSLGTRKVLTSDKRKDKPKRSSACSSAVKASKVNNFTDKTRKPGPCDTRQMKLKSMLIVPPTTNSCVLSNLRKRKDLPKFANVDPSRVLSTLYHHRKAREFRSPKKPIALFLTKKITPVSQTSGNHPYYFKRMQRELSYLKRKYQMLDLITLDNCYAMSGYSLKRAEIMLLDLISGKEVFATSDVDYESFSPQLLGSSSGSYVPQSHPEGNQFAYKESQSHQNSNKPLNNSDNLFRIAFVQALKVLYCDEGESI